MYIIIAISVLLALGAVVFLIRNNKKAERLTPLVSVAFGFIIVGIAFGGESRSLSYGLMGVGIFFAVVDAVLKEMGKMSERKKIGKKRFK